MTLNMSQDKEALQWWLSKTCCEEIPNAKGNDREAFNQRAKDLKKALYVYDYLLNDHGERLWWHIIQLQEVADEIDKVHKGVKIASITGGTVGALGAAAAVGGVLFAPFTLGASLAVTAVGVGVTAAGGATLAGAAITKKVHINTDRKKVETILKEHSEQIEEIERCVKFIGTNIEGLKKYDLSTLTGLDWETVKMARVAGNLGEHVRAARAVNRSSGVIQGFAMGLDMYSSKEDSKKLKKHSETKFAKKICKVAKQMEASLDELMEFKKIIGSQGI